MPRDGNLPGRGPRALDLANFFIADVQTGFGPFVAVYLTMHKWTQVQIGFVLTLGTIVALISQLPAGVLVDAVHNKRAAASGALLGVMVAALLLAIWPFELSVMVAQTLHAFSSCVLTPAIAAIRGLPRSKIKAVGKVPVVTCCSASFVGLVRDASAAVGWLPVSWLTTDPNFWTDLVRFATPGAVLLIIVWVLFR